MKAFLFLSLISLQLFATEIYSKKQGLSIVKEIVSSLEAKAWKNGHDNIESELEEFSNKRFSKFLSEEHRFMEDKLLNSEIEDIINCIDSDTCLVYKINISTEYYSGYGFDYHFVFFDRRDGSYSKRKYAGYNE